MMRLIAFLAAILLAASADAASTTSTNVDIIVTHAGGPVQTLIPMTQQSGTVFPFLAGTGSANTPIGNIVPAAIFPPTPAAFAGSWAITGGADAGKFKINPATGLVSVCNTAPSCTDLAAGSYSIVITVSQAGAVGSPASTTVTLKGVDPSDTKTPFVTVDNYAPTPGSTIHATVRNAPNASGTDYVQITLRYAREYSNLNGNPLYQQYVGTAGVHNAVLTLTVPNPPTDNYQFLHVDLIPNNGQSSQAIAQTSTILVPPSTAPTVPTAPNTLTQPFTAAQTLTVCPSGCQYALLSQAIIGLSNSNHTGGSVHITDNVLITVKAGTYQDCIAFGNGDPFTPPTDDKLWHLPQHLWIQGVGGSMPRLEGMLATLCQGKGIITFWGLTNTDVLYLENLEIADAPPAGPSGLIYDGTGNITLRNSYLHDGEMCMISGNPADFTLQNMHVARCGGSSGPAHDIYIGEGNLTVDHSLFEQAMLGHEIKTRAWIAHITCNQIRGSQDAYYVDSEEVDFAEGREAHLDNNTIVKGFGSSQQNQVGWAQDVEGGSPPQPPHIWAIFENNNIFIDDDLTHAHWFTQIGPGRVGPTYITNPPNVWNNNIFVGGVPGNTYPYMAEILPALPAYPDTSEITEIGDKQFATRAAAGITQTYPPPPGCSGTIGNMAVP